MDNKNTFEANNSFQNKKDHFISSNLDDRDLSFEDSFRAYPRASMNWFSYFDDRNKYENPLTLEFSGRSNNLGDKPIFKFEENPFREEEDSFVTPFNFFQLGSPADKARSYEKELTDDFDLSYSHLYFSADLRTIQEYEQQKQVKELNRPETYNLKPKSEVKQRMHQNVLWNSSFKVEDKRSSNSSPQQSSVDPESLSKLLKWLEKSRGVDKTQLDENLVARTIEFGQKKIAEQLNIPYRRYKSILNKWGIKTAAGRKVNNLQLESDLIEWALKIKDSGHILTRKMIRDKALEFSRESAKHGEKPKKKVSLSKGWLDKFVKRHEEIRDYLTSQKGKKGL